MAEKKAVKSKLKKALVLKSFSLVEGEIHRAYVKDGNGRVAHDDKGFKIPNIIELSESDYIDALEMGVIKGVN